MIIRAKRAVGGHGPWLLSDRIGALLDVFEPTPPVTAMMDGEIGYFEAEPNDAGWDIKHRVTDPCWLLVPEMRAQPRETLRRSRKRVLN